MRICSCPEHPTDKWEEKITDLCEIEDSQVLQPQLVYKMSAADLKNSYASYNDNSLNNLEIDDGEYIGIDYSLTFDDIPLMNDTEPGEGYNADIWAAQACYMPLFRPERFVEVQTFPFADLLKNNPTRYFEAVIILLMLYGGLCASCAYTVSVYVPIDFLTQMSPFLVTFLSTD